jgi:2,3-bisphosphoglycerate-independent phosphoglycerate mutase
MSSTKYAIILPDGAADEPLAELSGRTVLAAADTPHIDEIATSGRQGTVLTVPEGYLPGSDVATLSVLGCDVDKYYAGRAPLEAAARDIPVGPRDIVFRCNLVTVADGCMHDFTAGHIAQKEAARIIGDLNALFDNEPIDFFVGVQYRHLMVLRDVGDLDCTCTPPHDVPDQPVANHLPRGADAPRVQAIMDKAAAMLAEHEVNGVRADLGENPATNIWLWGQGRVKPLPTLESRFGLRGASIAAVDLIRGITRLIGCDQIEVPGATGFLDTNYGGKGEAAVAALEQYDLVITHIEAPDEAGHLGDTGEKIRAIERVDQHIVGPVLRKLRSFDNWRILVVPDHPTPVSTRTHTATPPPFCMAGTGISTVLGKPFSESAAVESGTHIAPGHELLEYFIQGHTR